MKYGYMRVSTAFEQSKERNQGFDRQLMILKEHGVEESNIFQDRISGGVSTKSRPAFDKMMSNLKAGDIIVVSEMSRFSRSLQDLIESVNRLIDNKIGIIFIKENISIDDNGLNPMNKLMFQMFGAFAEFERSLIAERVKAGMRASMANGNKMGAKPKLDDESSEEFKVDYLNGMTYTQLQEKYSLSKQSVANTIKRLGLTPRNHKREVK